VVQWTRGAVAAHYGAPASFRSAAVYEHHLCSFWGNIRWNHRISMEEQRKGPRIRSRGSVQLLANSRRVPRTISDVSVSGIGVEAEAAISPETPGKIDCGDIIAEGIIRFCRRQGSDTILDSLQALSAL
jgi:hypothetical protein